jgi:outer membrane immunogenic protein
VWVVGIEGDGGPFDKQGQSNDQFPFNPQFVNQTNERWIATLRGRLGYAVDKWLFYATGGVAWARVEETAWDGCSVNASGLGGAVVSPGCGASIVGPFPAAAVATAAVPRSPVHLRLAAFWRPPPASRASTTGRPWSATP